MNLLYRGDLQSEIVDTKDFVSDDRGAERGKITMTLLLHRAMKANWMT